uniref:Uncharacterized protein n=1 Tax=candidate division WOR-3 bacterium TaxID=2052148 RepID=A0A7C4YFP6_UNCW3
MVHLTENGEYITSIELTKWYVFFERIKDKSFVLPEYSFLLSPNVKVVSLKNGFYLIDVQTGLWIYKDGEVFVMDLDYLYKIFNKNDKNVMLRWEKLPKQKVFWQKMNLLAGCDLSRFYDLSNIEEKIKKYKKDKFLETRESFRNAFNLLKKEDLTDDEGDEYDENKEE